MTLVVPPAPPHESSSSTQSTLRVRILTIFREFLAIVFWTYAIIEVFVIDLDPHVARWIGLDVSLLKYKALMFLGMLAALFLVTSTFRATLSILYILFYPIILLYGFHIEYLRRKAGCFFSTLSI